MIDNFFESKLDTAFDQAMDAMDVTEHPSVLLEIPENVDESHDETVEKSAEGGTEDPTKVAKFLQFPLARIKQIIKLDPDVCMVTSDAVFLVAKASEMFVDFLSRDAYTFTSSSKKKTMQKRDVDSAIASSEPLFFLEGAMEW